MDDIFSCRKFVGFKREQIPSPNTFTHFQGGKMEGEMPSLAVADL